MTRSARFRAALTSVLVGGVLLAACTSASHSSTSSTATSSTTTTNAAVWAPIDRAVAALGPDVSFLAARVSADGICVPIHAVAASTPRPTASQFKLFVLGALANQIVAGRVSWNQKLTVTAAVKSLGNGPGSMQYADPGTSASVETVATKMISLSDNTAADMLIGRVGRNAVEAQVREWSSHASANEPFLTTREMLLLHYDTGLAKRYLAVPRAQRAAFLAASVDPIPLGAVASGLTDEPRDIDQVEWFASPADICRAFAGLQQLASQPALARELPSVLSRELGTIGLARSTWPTIWFKGGSEPGVLTLGWLATNARGETFVVEAMVSNPRVALATASITDLVAIERRVFGLLP